MNNEYILPIVFVVGLFVIVGPVVFWSFRRKGEPTQTPAATPATKRGGLAGAIFDAREGLFTGEMVTMTPEQKKARQRRSQWMALALFAFVILVFMITMTKVGAQIMVRDL